MVRRLGALLFVLAGVSALASACAGARTGDLEPRYVAVHNALAALGLVQSGPIQQGSLAEGRETRLRLELGAGCTTIVALGGPGVRDLDVSLLDAEEKPLGHDTTKDSQATLRVCPETAGPTTLVVRMAAGAGDVVAATWTGGGDGAFPRGDAGAAAALLAAANGAGNCESPLPLASGATTGNTRRGAADNVAGCSASESKELVYRLELERRQRVTIDVDPQFDSVLYVRKDDCESAEAEVSCNDDTPQSTANHANPHGSRIDEVFDAGIYFVFVDGYTNEVGAFRMAVDLAEIPSLAEVCQKRPPLLKGVPASGTTDTSFDSVRASCGDDARGADAAHSLVLPARSRVRVTESSSDFSPIVHLRRQCVDDRSEVGCGESGITTSDVAWAGVLDAGAYTVFADGKDKDARGRYVLELETASETGAGVAGDTCGDAKLLSGNDKRVEGDTFEAHDDLGGGACGGQGSPDVVYRFELAHRSRVSARMLDQEGKLAFTVMRSCADRTADVACGERIDDVFGPGVYYLAVDGQTPGVFGKFAFTFRVRDLAAQETACLGPPLLVPGQTVQGTTAGLGDRFSSSCAGRADGQASADRVYKIVLGSRSRVRLALSTPAWDGVLAIRRSCADRGLAPGGVPNEVMCNNDFQDNHHAKIENQLDPGTYFVVVDGHQAKNEGAFSLEYQILKN